MDENSKNSDAVWDAMLLKDISKVWFDIGKLLHKWKRRQLYLRRYRRRGERMRRKS